MDTAERVFIGLGTNLGDAAQLLASARVALAALPGIDVVAFSSLYRSAPVDAQGPDFTNAVAELRTSLEPEGLLNVLQSIEQAHGRRRPYHHAPRTLDLDLLSYGQRGLCTPRLTLPHPRAHLRAFVLQPWVELAPTFRLAGLGDIAALAAQVADQPIQKLP